MLAKGVVSRKMVVEDEMDRTRTLSRACTNPSLQWANVVVSDMYVVSSLCINIIWSEDV